MTNSNGSPAKETARAAREKRLAEALRANLKRRKAAIRAHASETDSEGNRPELTKPADSAKDKG
jgi:hypothetical protein